MCAGAGGAHAGTGAVAAHAVDAEPARAGGAGLAARAQLEERIYGWNEEIESNTVEVYIHSLRRKLGAEWIRNVRGVGYRVQELT